MTTEDLRHKTLKFLVSIVDMEKGEDIAALLNSHGYDIHYVSIAQGTAPTSIRTYWGFSDTEKSILWGIIPGDADEYILGLLAQELNLSKANTGVAFTMPIRSFAEPALLKYILENGDMPEGINEGEKEMEEKEIVTYSLLMAIVKKGFADDVMDAARSAGARGGTIFRARGTGDHETASFLGVTIEPEKDVIIILAKRGSRTAIMRSIYEKAGLHTEGNGLVFALPVERVVGSFNLNNEIIKKAEENGNSEK
ncbi:MAG TPA: P-II family nitrogen regulator [Clostridia bacterium]|jgi:nitrogen regulatory protein PII|nr:P-II family nitrogen regulator [Clostridia bacterium]